MTEVSSEAVYQTLAVAIEVSPSGKVQEAFARTVSNMKQAGESNKSIVVALTGGIRDGLMHGNWPS